MASYQQRIGKAGQNQAAAILSGMGINMVEPIGSPVSLTPFAGRKDVFYVHWGEKVSGDHTGILNDGRRVLIETKTVLDRNLRFSDMREHQPDRLERNTGYNGISLLVWVHSTGTFVMQFPIEGFGPGKSIDPVRAFSLHLEFVNWLEENNR